VRYRDEVGEQHLSMNFHLPHHGFSFEIHDAWLKAASAVGVVLEREWFHASFHPHPVTLVRTAHVIAPVRAGGAIWFDESRMVEILHKIVHGHSLPPLIAEELPEPNPYRYRIHSGFHRFYASAALGLAFVPVSFTPLTMELQSSFHF
jgi:hypothetical protein